MNTPQLKFSIRGILLAMTWMCVCFGAFAIITSIHKQRISTAWEGVLTWVMMVAPFVAAGAMFGRALVGLIVGLVAVKLFWVIFYLT